MSLRRYDCDPDESTDDLESWREEEQASLRQSLRALQTQFAGERARREEAEREAELLAGENAALEQQLVRLEGCQVHLMDTYTHTHTWHLLVNYSLSHCLLSSPGQSVGAGARG